MSQLTGAIIFVALIPVLIGLLKLRKSQQKRQP